MTSSHTSSPLSVNPHVASCPCSHDRPAIVTLLLFYSSQYSSKQWERKRQLCLIFVLRLKYPRSIFVLWWILFFMIFLLLSISFLPLISFLVSFSLNFLHTMAGTTDGNEIPKLSPEMNTKHSVLGHSAPLAAKLNHCPNYNKRKRT